mmetsp:Transcript_6146/g.13954  ORF Transcript_6146/g.13954 Transcript_6146/m.13954 type:complete len:254 (-) Transcript_6146:46-807(-)|eukprot:CAMPEP_0206134436 /NCGR_PEP_ID=MMETSP1472-20131121/54819_1 /ASSEMBLY_ACC=CAM_ASM_001108 /TAXON_ID=41880 /ORGANISM="Pycnococcus provasolii, Strain RCC251" /LENGTH=253 /DNA_ID=CAMNT_0053526041 /DNA_START=217 /DNA_END=978 /DNA_ORIENTATION=+
MMMSTTMRVAIVATLLTVSASTFAWGSPEESKSHCIPMINHELFEETLGQYTKYDPYDYYPYTIGGKDCKNKHNCEKWILKNFQQLPPRAAVEEVGVLPGVPTPGFDLHRSYKPIYDKYYHDVLGHRYYDWCEESWYCTFDESYKSAHCYMDQDHSSCGSNSDNALMKLNFLIPKSSKSVDGFCKVWDISMLITDSYKYYKHDRSTTTTSNTTKYYSHKHGEVHGEYDSSYYYNVATVSSMVGVNLNYKPHYH